MNNDSQKAGLKSTGFKLSALAASVAMASISLPSFSQGVFPEKIEEISVTGSRLESRGFDTPAPVSVVGEEEFTLTGTQNVENLLLDTPQFYGNQLEGPSANTVQASSPVGTSSLNLRNFGATRNLVLVNGRRFAISGPAMTADINTIPAALIERVEVVTGGSSAVYGSDAIAGVVNFIMRDDFEGIELDVKTSFDEPTTSTTNSIDITMGGNFDNDRGNMTASFSYLDREGFTAAERGGFATPSLSDACVSAASYSDEGPGTSINIPDGETCRSAGGIPGFSAGGSSAVPNGRLGNLPLYGSDPEFDAALSAAGLEDMTSLGAIFGDQGETLRPFRDPDDRFDLGDASFLWQPQERWMGNLFGHYDLNDNMTAYMELHGSTNVTNVQIAPTNITGNLLVDTDNPYVSPEVQDIFALLDERETGPTDITQGSATLTTTPNDGLAIINYNRRFSDLPTRFADADHNVFRTALGVRGDLGDASDSFLRDLSYDAYYTYARTSETDILTGSVSRSQILRSMISQNGEDPLLNIFGQNISDEAAAAIGVSSIQKIEAEQEVAVASLTGIAFDMPAGPVDFALGYEYRKSEASFTPDQFLSTGDVSGFNAARATDGSQEVNEVFGETRIPLLVGLPGVERLTLTSAFRYSDYDVGADDPVWTYSFGGEWSITPELSMRSQFQHAIRAPNVGELFGGQGTDGPSAIDPCSSRQPESGQTAAVRETCIANGVPADLVFDPAVQPSPFLTQVRGGNPDLQPEESDTFTLGLYYEPEAVPGLSLGIDYFNIELDDAIAPLGGGGIQSVLDLCFLRLQDPSSQFCQAINRDPRSGEIAAPGFVSTTNANTGGIETSGFDFKGRYGMSTEWGLFDGGSDWELSTSWTYTDEFTVTPIQAQPEITNECVGAWGGTCGQPLPDVKGTTRLTWFSGPATISLRGRFIGEVEHDSIVVPRARGESYPDPANQTTPKIDSHVYFDLTGGLAVGDNTQLTLGVQNLLDKEPPVLGSKALGSNTIPATYDFRGRVFFFNVKVKL